MRPAPETLAEARKADAIARQMRGLANAVRERRNAEDHLRHVIPQLRKNGVPWSTIARELGVTKQAAQRRYGQRKLTPKTPTDSTPLFDLESVSEAHTAS